MATGDCQDDDDTREQVEGNGDRRLTHQRGRGVTFGRRGDTRLQLLKGMWMNRLLLLAEGSTTVVQRELRMQTYAWSWVW